MKMKMIMSRFSIVALCLMASGLSSVELQAVEVTQPIVPAKVQQRYPWNGLVDIQLTNAQANAKVILSAKDMTTGQSLTVKTLTLGGEAFTNGVSVVTNDSVHLVWDTVSDVGENVIVTNARFFATLKFEPLYMVVDLSGGTNVTTYPITYRAGAPSRGWTIEYKMTKLVMRRIESGTFTMGSPSDEAGRESGETQHTVILTQDYWMGVFEITQKQYELVMGTNPSYWRPREGKDYLYRCPVERVTYDKIRGTGYGDLWPTHNQVDADSFMGRLRGKTDMLFDLPTEAQWEYVCRAGTSTALNNGKNLTSTNSCSNMAAVGRYLNNHNDGKGGWYEYHAIVGQYKPNAWGFYDMHGNVYEWCLDWYGTLSSTTATNPKGGMSGSYRVIRGGSWSTDASGCRSATRYYCRPSNCYQTIGFRVACSAEQD